MCTRSTDCTFSIVLFAGWYHLCRHIDNDALEDHLLVWSSFELTLHMRTVHTTHVIYTDKKFSWTQFVCRLDRRKYFNTNLFPQFTVCTPQNYLHAWIINEPHLPYKTGLDVMQSHPLHRMRFGQYQASSACIFACYTVVILQLCNKTFFLSIAKQTL